MSLFVAVFGRHGSAFATSGPRFTLNFRGGEVIIPVMLGSLLLVVAGFVGTMPQQRPAPAVSGASANVESREVPTLILRVTNLDEVGLQALEVDVHSSSGPVRKVWSATTTPLGTGGTGEMAVGPLGSDRALPVTVRFAIFADGTVAGAPADVARLQTTSIALAEDLSAWREILTRVPEVPDADAVHVLRQAADARKRTHATDPSGMRRLVEVWLREERAQGFFASVARGELRIIAERLRGPGPIAAAARLSPGPRLRNDLNTLVRAVTTTGAVKHFAISVTNERAVPLEAWAVVLTDAQSGRPLRAIGRDVGLEVPPGAPVVPFGSLEVGSYQPGPELAGGVRAHLEFVMWQDLTWQGYPVNQQRTLANRERRAQEHEFFVPAIRAAAALPPMQALAQLNARQAEFKAGPLASQSSGLQAQLEEWARTLATSPDGLAARLTAHASALEHAIASLLRHQRK